MGLSLGLSEFVPAVNPTVGRDGYRKSPRLLWLIGWTEIDRDSVEADVLDVDYWSDRLLRLKYGNSKTRISESRVVSPPQPRTIVVCMISTSESVQSMKEVVRQ